MFGTLCVWIPFAATISLADDTVSTEPPRDPPPQAPAPVPPAKGRWGGYALPLIGANSVDGFGFGVGGEVFKRPPGQEHGYKFKLTLSSWLTVPPNYISQYAQLEVRGEVTQLYRFGYQAWRNLPYAGSGGAEVATAWDDELEKKNRIQGPYLVGAVAKPIGGHWRGYAQGYVHGTWVNAYEGGLLDTRQPFGAEGGWYADLTAGGEYDSTDRWPLPVSGTRAEVDLRGGATLSDGGVAPLVGVHAEHIRWQPVFGERLVVGTRVVAEKSFGQRPMMEQFVTGGRWRDELGFEQVFAGYGRIRTRGDGLVAAAVEVRPKLFATKIRGAELDGYLSAFAEVGWLFDGSDPGPALPTIGIGPEILWQRGSQLRPFVAWGWMSETTGGPRSPQLLFGLSTMDPL